MCVCVCVDDVFHLYRTTRSFLTDTEQTHQDFLHGGERVVVVVVVGVVDAVQ